MTALTAYAASLNEEFRELRELTEVSAGPKLISTVNHHIQYGRNLPELYQAYRLEEIPGVGQWFQEMDREFFSPEGLPLPFTGAIREVTGEPPRQALEWLSANLTDEITAGSEESIMAFFRNNPKAYSICLVLGIAFGLYSNKASLVALNGMEYYCKLRKEGRWNKGLWSNTDRFIRTSFLVSGTTDTTNFISDKALELLDAKFPSKAGNLLGGIGAKIGKAAARAAMEAASAIDVVGGASNLGLSLLLGQAVGRLVTWFNDDVRRELAQAASLLESRQQLLELLSQEVPPETLTPVIELMMAGGGYKGMLNESEKLTVKG
jgi:hypothetical protein